MRLGYPAPTVDESGMRPSSTPLERSVTACIPSNGGRGPSSAVARLMEVGVRDREGVVLRTTWHAWRYHVDLCRTAAALCSR